jgi:hypothetical protein
MLTPVAAAVAVVGVLAAVVVAVALVVVVAEVQCGSHGILATLPGDQATLAGSQPERRADILTLGLCAKAAGMLIRGRLPVDVMRALVAVKLRPANLRGVVNVTRILT